MTCQFLLGGYEGYFGGGVGILMIGVWQLFGIDSLLLCRSVYSCTTDDSGNLGDREATKAPSRRFNELLNWEVSAAITRVQVRQRCAVGLIPNCLAF
jgi:hypothetical protein